MSSWHAGIRSLFSLFVLLLITPVAQPFFFPVRYHPVQRSCGTAHPSQHLEDSHRWLQDNEPLNNDLWNSSMVHQRQAAYRTGRHQRRQSQSPTVYTIDTYFHVVSDTASASSTSSNYVSASMIQSQLTYLVNAYTPYAIGFRLVSIDRTTNDTWAANGDDTNMKRTLRRGTYASLNIYFQTQLQAAPGTPGIPAGSTLLGFCSLPSTGITSTTAPSVYVSDGCNILSSTMPGGTMSGYNLGGTTAHEVGHWNGLLHPFQGNTCDPNDFGDYVADTPQESSSTNGCPAGKDTCPTSGVAPGYTGASNQAPNNPYGPQGYSGVDPIHNYMDYSNDACYTGFTAGQAARMLNVWDLYRQGL